MKKGMNEWKSGWCTSTGHSLDKDRIGKRESKTARCSKPQLKGTNARKRKSEKSPSLERQLADSTTFTEGKEMKRQFSSLLKRKDNKKLKTNGGGVFVGGGGGGIGGGWVQLLNKADKWVQISRSSF